MDDTLTLQAIFLGTMGGAGVVLFGAFYALFFALGKLHASRWLAAAALASFGALTACSIVLARALALEGIWLLVVAVMLVGYLFAPRAIWHLCVGTHAGESDDEPPLPAPSRTSS